MCAKCDTPHHADCWNYSGRCAVYGCMPAPAAAPMVVAESAERVTAIVPAAGARQLTWQADAAGAWLGARDGSITPAAGERVVMLPPAVLAELRHPDERTADARRGAAIYLASAATLVSGAIWFVSAAAGAKLALAGALSLLVGVLRSAPSAAPAIAWLSATAKGIWVHGITRGRAWELPLEGALAPSRVRLERSYESGETDSSRTLLTYRLVLQWPLHERDAISPFRELAAPLQMPETSAERRPVLEQLVARRALGQHIAAALSIPFEEGVRPS